MCLWESGVGRQRESLDRESRWMYSLTLLAWPSAVPLIGIFGLSVEAVRGFARLFAGMQASLIFLERLTATSTPTSQSIHGDRTPQITSTGSYRYSRIHPKARQRRGRLSSLFLSVFHRDRTLPYQLSNIASIFFCGFSVMSIYVHEYRQQHAGGWLTRFATARAKH